MRCQGSALKRGFCFPHALPWRVLTQPAKGVNFRL